MRGGGRQRSSGNNSMSHSLEHKVVIFRTLPGALHRCKAGQLISISHSVTPPAQLTERTTMAQDTGATRGSVCVCVCLCWFLDKLLFSSMALCIHCGGHLYKGQIVPFCPVYLLLFSNVCNLGNLEISLNSLKYPTHSRERQSHSGYWAF